MLLDFDGTRYLVELRWSDRPLDFRQLAPHLVTLYGCPDLRRLFISSSGFTEQAIRDLGSILPLRLVLCQLQESSLLEEGRDLKELLRDKVRAAETKQKPQVADSSRKPRPSATGEFLVLDVARRQGSVAAKMRGQDKAELARCQQLSGAARRSEPVRDEGGSSGTLTPERLINESWVLLSG